MQFIKDRGRKEYPLFRGLFEYFPYALLEVAHVSFVGNKQHNEGDKLVWSRNKSNDHLDAMLRHTVEAGDVDSDGIRHSAKVAWRALANLQLELEKSEYYTKEKEE
jgi:hypothetical protein